MNFEILLSIILALYSISGQTFQRSRQARPVSIIHQSIGNIAAETTLQARNDPGGVFASSFVAQKNYILLEKLEKPEGGDYATAAMNYVNFCDESFNKFLNERIAEADSDEEKYESAMKLTASKRNYGREAPAAFSIWWIEAN